MTLNLTELSRHPTLAATGSVRELAGAFLEAHRLIHFSMVRIYADGTNFCLTTHPEMTLDFHRLALYDSNDFSRDLKDQTSCSLLWLGCHETNRTLFQYAEEGHHLANGLVCIETKPSFQDQWYYASTPDRPEVNNFYLNNLDAIRQQNAFFLDAAHDLVTMAETHRLPAFDPATLPTLQSPLLSPREAELLSLLSLGHSCKHAADTMGIKTKHP